MFQPKYDLTKTLLTNITQIERLYGQLESLKIPQKLELNLERDNLIQSAYVSNSIEGNPLSEREVTNLLLSDRIPVNRDEKEVSNYFHILKTLNQESKKDIDINLTLEIHKNLMEGVKDQIQGEIRNERVVIGKYLSQLKTLPKLKVKHEPPSHKRAKIELELKKLYIWLEHEQDLPIAIKTGIFHHHFVYIHPFVDGNGRVCRLLTALVFLKSNYFINKYFVLDDYYDIDRMMYSDKLHTADSGDKTEWLEYFSEGSCGDGINGSTPELFSKLAEGPAALVHGDMQLDNVWFGHRDVPVILFDWAGTMRAKGAEDIAHFLSDSYPVDQRRENEDHLLNTYIEKLRSFGIVDLPLPVLREHIAARILLTLITTPLSVANRDFSKERTKIQFHSSLERCMAMWEDYPVGDVL